MSWSDIYRRYARYNRTMNQQLLEACMPLSREQLEKSCGLYFDSLLGTWNHLLVTDILWLKRLSLIFPILEELHDLPTPGALNVIFAPDLNSLRPLRERLDDTYIRWCDLLRADDARDVLQYTNSRGEEMAKPLDLVLQHIFNHQTHHRGQITAELSRLGVDFGITDLLLTADLND
ncbi:MULTISPECIES: DinB family protein [Thalassolituus]|uniref:DinB family protein n=1 Tax=Thalassolituus TaxID=187492 RepID=UPI001E3324F8|nr:MULTISPECIES: DinB family protein [Thalassolituus]MCB2385214.1 damage-inducible protein DinB [Thalassolituus alkanivorans]MCB2421929.1 damage-inducible protein DinB [Thalassolituus alkanivorans]